MESIKEKQNDVLTGKMRGPGSLTRNQIQAAPLTVLSAYTSTGSCSKVNKMTSKRNIKGTQQKKAGIAVLKRKKYNSKPKAFMRGKQSFYLDKKKIHNSTIKI